MRRALHKELPPHCHCRDWHLLYSSRVHGLSLETLYRRVGDAEPVILIVRPVPPPAPDDAADNARTDGTEAANQGPRRARGDGAVFGAFLASKLQPAARPARGCGESVVWSFCAGAPAGASPALPLPEAPASPAAAPQHSFAEAPTGGDESGASSRAADGLRVWRWRPDANDHLLLSRSSLIKVGGGEAEVAPDHEPTSLVAGTSALFLPATLADGATYACPTFASPPLWHGAGRDGSFVVAAIDVLCVD